MKQLPSKFQIGDPVEVAGKAEVVSGVKFTEGKVWYEINGQMLDSCDVREPFREPHG